MEIRPNSCPYSGNDAEIKDDVPIPSIDERITDPHAEHPNPKKLTAVAENVGVISLGRPCSDKESLLLFLKKCTSMAILILKRNAVITNIT